MFFIQCFWYNQNGKCVERIMQVSPISAENNKDKYLKAKVAATTALAVGCTYACIAKKQGFSLSLKKMKEAPIKDWAIFRLYDKNNPTRKELKVEGKEIITLATASVAGGLAGGLIFDDKKYIKSKFRESVNQLLGNVLVPIGCVWGISELYKKHKAKIMDLVPQINETGKKSHIFNKALKCIPGSVATLTALGIGILAGNRVSNYLNEKVFHKKVERNIKPSDFAPHVDDIGIAVSLMAEKSKPASFIQRSIPLFLCVPGYEVGTHRE